MKRAIRLTALAVLFLTVALPILSSCKKETSYTDDLSCAEIMDAVEDQIPVNFGYETFGGDHMRYYFEETPLPDDHCLRYSVMNDDINEVGIFHSPDGKSEEEVFRLTEAYLATLREEKQAFIGSYAPEELPKLNDAEVRRFGNYTVYAILSEEDRKLVFETVEKMLIREN